ncbi:hypothetical protein [Actinocrispum sp. NPDC049592]|uniref:hypothetical protein n=1 Tax=Actinocrispum sp. NPDC049592 TaxID=3154835 RepID=UPI003446ABDB
MRERNTVVVPDVAPALLAPLGCGIQTGLGAVLNVLASGAAALSLCSALVRPDWRR